MMKHTRYTKQLHAALLLMAVSLAAVVSSCSTSADEVENPSSAVASVELALSVSTRTQTTRMAPDTIQQSANFRGIQDWTLIPFPDKGIITISSTPLTGRIENLSRVSTTNNYFDDQAYDLDVGTSSFLCYGRATLGNGTKFQHGSTVVNYGNYAPRGITFSPEHICTQADAQTAISPLLTYLNNIANAKVNDGTDHYWRDETENDLSNLFQSLINYNQIMAGSSASIKCLVTALYNTVLGMSPDASGNTQQKIAQEILTQITNGLTEGTDYTGGTDKTTDPIVINSLGTGRDDFPASVNLPDGAIAIKWNSTSNQFELQSSATSISPIGSLAQFVYPAELWYYANSTIKTSTTSQASHYNVNNWSENAGNVLSYYETDDATIDLNTRSVAIKNPLNYGVGSVKAYMWATAYHLPDANNDLVPLYQTESDYNFTLTAVLLGGQYPQRFDFQPVDNRTGMSEGITYDKAITASPLKFDADGTDGPDNPDYFYTMALQTIENEDVKIIFEFEYSGAEKFMGHDGYIFPGMKFYLVGEISHTNENPIVVEQDKQAELKVKISSLANAYNVIPDLTTITEVLNVVTIGVKNWSSQGEIQQGVYNW